MNQTCLFFEIGNAHFALDVARVREIVWLPALSAIEELPGYYPGTFNLRGRVIPVMDLEQRFGHAPRALKPSNRVIIIEHDGIETGLIATRVNGIRDVSPDMMEAADRYTNSHSRTGFVLGEVKLDGGLAMLLDIPSLLYHGDPATLLEQAPDRPSSIMSDASPLTGEETELMQQRALALASARAPYHDADDSREGFVAVGFGPEVYAIEVLRVRQLCHIGSIAPLPCSPPWLLGNMNLRGEILSLVDVRGALGIVADEPCHEVVVISHREQMLGLPVCRIIDVISLSPAEIKPLPLVARRTSASPCRGSARYGDRPVGILNLDEILRSCEEEIDRGSKSQQALVAT